MDRTSPNPPNKNARVESISAVTLLTADIEASIKFYESLGLRMVHGGPSMPLSSFQIGNGFLNLLKSDGPGREGEWGRIILHVSNVDAIYERCIQLGYEPSTKPVDAPWGERYFHITDPGGHELSFARPMN